MVRLALVIILIGFPVIAQDRDTLRLELVLDPRSEQPFVGEMVLATIRGIYSEHIGREDLKLRPMTDFDWNRLGQDAWTEDRVDGRRARVMERRVALYPRRAGTLEILPIAHELEIIGADGQRHTEIVRSDPVRVDVREIPAGAGEAWLPVRAVELSETWSVDPARLEDGQSTERRVVLRALGATPEMMPEQPDLREPWLITFSQPETRDLQVTTMGPVTTVVWRWTLRPITGEPGVLHGVDIPWFDTDERVARSAAIPVASIGYASFADNAISKWREDPGMRPAHVISAGVGLLVGLVLLLRNLGPSPYRLGRLRRYFHRHRDLYLLRRYAKRGELGRFRKFATCMLDNGTRMTQSRDHPVLQPLDAILFGPNAHRSREDLATLMLSVRFQIASSRSKGKRDGAPTSGA